MKSFFLDFLYRPTVRKHILLVLIGCVLGILSYLFVGYAAGHGQDKFLWVGLLGICIAYVTYGVTRLLNAWLPWKSQSGGRLLAGIIANAMLAYVMVWVAERLYFLLSKNEIYLFQGESQLGLKILILIFFISLIYNVVYFALHSYYEYAKGQLITLQLERQQTELQLAALKSQLRPHFLFNSMNTISALLTKDTDLAERYIRQLASSYQYMLNNYKRKLVSVKEELQFVEAYSFLLKTRFEDSVQIDIDLHDLVLDSKIPPLTLQMLVENAVKHNQMSADQKLYVKIGHGEKKIHVSNNKTSRPKKVDSLHIGLDNIAGRYELLTHKEIEIVDDEDFTIKLPIIS